MTATTELLAAAHLTRRRYSIEAIIGMLGDDARARLEYASQSFYDFPARALDAVELGHALRLAAAVKVPA